MLITWYFRKFRKPNSSDRHVIRLIDIGISLTKSESFSLVLLLRADQDHLAAHLDPQRSGTSLFLFGGVPRCCHRVIALAPVSVAPSSDSLRPVRRGCADSGANPSKTEVFRRAEYASVIVHRALRSNERLLEFLQRLRRSDRRQRQIWVLLGSIHTQNQFLARLAANPQPGVLIQFGYQYWRLLTVVNF